MPLMRSRLDPPDIGTHRRIEYLLVSLEERLRIYADGILNWSEPLPSFEGVPRRWPLDDCDAKTVGEALLSRYAGYEWSVVEHLMEPASSLRRAAANGRMTHEQERRLAQCCRRFDEVRPVAIQRGIAYDWRTNAVAPALAEMRPDHPAVAFVRQLANAPRSAPE
jgi:hypothetical protein